MKKLIFIIGLLLAVIIYFAAIIIRLENYHYAVQVGSCMDVSFDQRDECLNKIQTRTNPLFHLLEAVF